MKKYIINYKKNANSDDYGFIALIIFIIFVVGIIFLIPAILGLVSFIGELFGASGSFFSLSNLSDNWTYGYSKDGGGGMSAAPIYLGIMGLIGSLMILSSIFAFLILLKIDLGQEGKIDSIEKIEN